MATKKIRMRPEGTNDYGDVLHPETSASVVLFEDGTSVESHKADYVKHITSQERNNWNSKQNALPIENRRRITFGTADPSGGVDGDIYFQYE